MIMIELYLLMLNVPDQMLLNLHRQRKKKMCQGARFMLIENMQRK